MSRVVTAQDWIVGLLPNLHVFEKQKTFLITFLSNNNCTKLNYFDALCKWFIDFLRFDLLRKYLLNNKLIFKIRFIKTIFIE